MVAVNLLPWRQRYRQQQRRQRLILESVLPGILLLVLLQQSGRIHQARQAVLQAGRVQQQALDRLDRLLAEQKQLLEQTAVLKKQQARQRQLAAQRVAWQQFWHDLPTLLPDAAWLTRLELREHLLTLEGQAQDMAAARQFRQQLSACPLFVQVKQGGVKRQPDGRYQFSLRAKVQEVKGD